jgi:glycosyltransferase involved in cell wall biosynthesis
VSRQAVAVSVRRSEAYSIRGRQTLDEPDDNQSYSSEIENGLCRNLEQINSIGSQTRIAPVRRAQRLNRRICSQSTVQNSVILPGALRAAKHFFSTAPIAAAYPRNRILPSWGTGIVRGAQTRVASVRCCDTVSRVSVKISLLTTDNRENFREYSKPDPWFGTAPEALLQGLSEVRDLEVHVTCCVQQKVRSPEKLASNIYYHSLLVPKPGWLRTGYQGCIRAVRAKLRQIRPDLVHGQGTERDCAVSAIFSGYRNVLTIHGNMRLIAKVNRARPFSYQWLAARLERFTLPRSDGIVCITNYTREAVQPVARRTWVIPNAVDASFFKLSPIPDAPPALLCVGNVSVRKNQQQLIRALDPLAEKYAFRLLFVGAAPPQDPYCAEFLRMLQTRSWCSYAGIADRESLKRYLSRAALLVLPSLEDNCPMVVLEAMAAGIPVAAASVGGVPELIQHEVTGLLFDPLDPAGIASAIQRTLDSPDTALDLARRAKQAAAESFHPRRVAERHLRVYQEILGNRGK